jgi:hypothetical protein
MDNKVAPKHIFEITIIINVSTTTCSEVTEKW